MRKYIYIHPASGRNQKRKAREKRKHTDNTPHCPQTRPDQTPAGLARTFADFHAEATRLRDQHAHEIELLVGLETEWIARRSGPVIAELRTRFAFDFFVGSVHHVGGVPIDFDRPTYELARGRAGGGEEELFVRYFDEQFEMLAELRPAVVGHFDVVRLWSDEPDAGFGRWPRVWERIERNLRFVSEYGGLLELNSAALRKGLAEPYPNAQVCQVGMFSWCC
jgi:histidinol-phosphatase (PHP family)